ncbi:WD40 repeat-like protein [Patellaria atrata CBS 101060]|uniref:WD40 repeat-like protein n=1 Tax=Patellaria atrata CBS 101060 TaxID=1346257 RepID=A0A9P4S3Q1_9PEZI|nr:WD40 repeat-like protein [Patellaria atrata CBS 101060]
MNPDGTLNPRTTIRIFDEIDGLHVDLQGDDLTSTCTSLAVADFASHADASGEMAQSATTKDRSDNIRGQVNGQISRLMAQRNSLMRVGKEPKAGTIQRQRSTSHRKEHAPSTYTPRPAQDGPSLLPPPVSQLAPPNPAPLPQKTRSRSFLHSLQQQSKRYMGRRPAVSGPSGVTTYNNPTPRLPIPPSTSNLVYSTASNTPSYGRGDAARAAAALARQEKEKEFQKQTSLAAGDNKLWSLKRTTTVKSDSMSKHYGIPSDSATSLLDDVPMIDEGAGLLCTKPKDPTTVLPTELFATVLAQLDYQSLTKCESVSKTWRVMATSHHIWREVFLKRYQPKIHVTPTPVIMGGNGIGEIVPGQDWKRLYRARKTIELRWLLGRPTAIYFNGHTDSVYCCQFDEDKIITGSRDRTIRVWDMNTYECMKVIGGPASRPVINTPPSLPVQPSVTQFNNPSLNGTPKGDSIYHIPKDYHSASILCLQFDDEIMVTGSSDTTCIVWDIQTFEPMFRLAQHNAGVLDVCFDKEYIISCSKDTHICVWERKTGNLLRVLTGHRGPVNAVQLRGKLLVSASGDGVAKLWNLEDGKCLKEFTSKTRGLAAVEFSDDAKYVLAGGNDQVVYKFNTETGEIEKEFKGHSGLVRSLFVDVSNNRVISGSYDQSIRVSDYTTGEDINHYLNWTTSWILSAKSDYRRLVATSQDGRALLLDFGYGTDDAELLRGHKRRKLASDYLAEEKEFFSRLVRCDSPTA